MSGETETVGVDLNGAGFVEGAHESIAAADAYSAALLKLDEAGQRVRDPKFGEASKISEQAAQVNALAAARAKIGAFDPTYTRELAKQEQLYAKMRDDALGITAARNKEENKALDGQAMTLAGDALSAAGTVVLAGAAAISAAAWALEKAGVATTDKHDTEGAVGGHLGADYERSVFLSLKAGVDVDATWLETKRLLVAKFSEKEIPALIRIKTGMDMAGENGSGFLNSLEKIKLEPKVQTRDLERVWKFGLDSKEVYAELARTMGTDVAGAMAKVKSGTADSAQVLGAIETVASHGKFGAIADELGKSVPAAIAHLKGDLAELFDFGSGATDGIKNALGNASGVIEGGEGVELRASMKGLFDELNHDLLGGFQGEEGKAKIREFAASVTSSLNTITDAVHSVSGAADELSGFWKKIDWTGAPSWLRPDSSKAVEKPPEQAPGANAQVFTSTNGGEAVGAGATVPSGFAQGIRNGEHEPIAAAGEMADKTVAEARRRLDAHSPSRVAADDIGAPVAQGMALGMSRDPSPAAAGRAMAAGAVQAAQSGSVAATSGRGSSGASASDSREPASLSVSLSVTGSVSAVKEWQEMLPVVEACVRRIDRDRHERAGGP